jgi:hypothetical protein
MTAKVVPFKRPYFTIDNDLIDVHAKTIGAYGIAIYTYLRRRMKHGTRQCWPSVKTIAEDLDIAESTVKVYLKKIVNARLIFSEARWDTAGDPTSNLYTFPEHVPAEAGGGGSADDPPWVGTQPTPGSADAHKQSESLEQKEKKEEKPARAEDKGEENPQQAPIVSSPSTLPERPDDLLKRLGLDKDTFARLQALARDTLISQGVKPFCLITPQVHTTMIALWEQYQAHPQEHGGVSTEDLSLERIRRTAFPVPHEQPPTP